VKANADFRRLFQSRSTGRRFIRSCGRFDEGFVRLPMPLYRGEDMIV
jgi:hypothetical protein